MRIVEALLVVGLAGCQAIGEADLPTFVERVDTVRDRMHARFVAAKSTQLALAVGDLDHARAEARFLMTQDEPDSPAEWRPYLDQIRRDAAQVAASQDTVTAAKTMAQLGRSCGRCHEAMSAKLVFSRETEPPETGALASQMASHQWAAARMWEGLIGSADDRWLAGARALAGSRLTLTAEGGELGIADDAARTKVLAARAVRIGDRDERATIFGDLLATCSHCHATIRDRTALPPAVARGR